MPLQDLSEMKRSQSDDFVDYNIEVALFCKDEGPTKSLMDSKVIGCIRWKEIHGIEFLKIDASGVVLRQGCQRCEH